VTSSRKGPRSVDVQAIREADGELESCRACETEQGAYDEQGSAEVHVQGHNSSALHPHQVPLELSLAWTLDAETEHGARIRATQNA
jgi:hypothetical protein